MFSGDVINEISHREISVCHLVTRPQIIATQIIQDYDNVDLRGLCHAHLRYDTEEGQLNDVTIHLCML